MHDDSPFSCPQCGCEEVRWAVPMGVELLACSCRACGLAYLIEQESAHGDEIVDEEECDIFDPVRDGWIRKDGRP